MITEISTYLFNYRFMTTKREPLRRKPSTLNFGMLEDLSAVPAVSKARERSSTILLMVKEILNGSLCMIYMLFQKKSFVVSLGIVLVHDLTNKKSSQNLYRWSLEALNKDSSPTGVIVSNGYVLFFNRKRQTPIGVKITAYDESNCHFCLCFSVQ